MVTGAATSSMPRVQASVFDPVDVHRARAAHAFATRPAEGEGRIDLGFDPDEGVENHRPAIVAVDEIGVHARVCAIVRIPAIDAEFGDPRGVGRLRPRLARLDAGVFGEGELDQEMTFESSNSSTRAGAKFGKSANSSAGGCRPHLGHKSRIGCHEVSINMFATREIQAVVDRMGHLNRDPQGARDEKGGRYHRFEQTR